MESGSERFVGPCWPWLTIASVLAPRRGVLPQLISRMYAPKSPT